ncbi:MAG: NAD(P)/FAD-dependent oxidoreductase, partial [Halovenus sp.]
KPLKKWKYDNKGTVISVGEDAVAHNVSVVPFVDTFGGLPARTLKKAIAARWISDITGYKRALDAWPDM